MEVDASNGMGLYGKLMLGVDEKTGKITGGSDVFIKATEELYEAKLKTKEPVEANKKRIDQKLEALASLQSKAKDLQATSSKLFHTDPLGNLGVFSDMYAGFTSTSTTPVTDLIDLNLVANANLQEFSLEVTQLAKHDTTMAATGLTSSANALGWTGNYTINGVAIEVTATKSLNDIKDDINRQSDTTFVLANIIKVTDTDYRLSLQSTKYAQPITIASTLVGPNAGEMPVASGQTANNLSASFKFNDIAMTRTDNNITDVVDGMTVVLKKAEPGAKMSISLQPDQDSVKNAIRSWVVSLNNLIDEVAIHKEIDYDNKAVSDKAVLHGTNILHEMDAIIRDNMSWVVNGNTYKDLDDIGLKPDYFTGKISLDEQALDAAVKNDFEGVQKLFEYQNKLSNSNLLVSSHPTSVSNSIIADSNGNALTSTITLNKDASGNVTAAITINGGDYAGKTFNVASNKITVNANVIQFSGENAIAAGVVDNPYYGFDFVYIGASSIANEGSDSSTLKVTQGFADRVTSSLGLMLQDYDGNFALQKADFISNKEVLNKKIEKITQAAQAIKEKFQKQIAQMEAARQQLTAIKNAADVFLGMMTKK